MTRYIVYISVDNEAWGEYELMAASRESAAFLAGAKFQYEIKMHPWAYYTCTVVVPSQ